MVEVVLTHPPDVILNKVPTLALEVESLKDLERDTDRVHLTGCDFDGTWYGKVSFTSKAARMYYTYEGVEPTDTGHIIYLSEAHQQTKR